MVLLDFTTETPGVPNFSFVCLIKTNNLHKQHICACANWYLHNQYHKENGHRRCRSIDMSARKKSPLSRKKELNRDYISKRHNILLSDDAFVMWNDLKSRENLKTHDCVARTLLKFW